MTTILHAEDVPVSDLSGYAYLYVTAKCLPLHQFQLKDFQTKPVHARFCPTFNETITFPVGNNDLNKQTLCLYLYEMNRWTRKEGKAHLALDLEGLDLDLGEEHVLRRQLTPYVAFVSSLLVSFLSVYVLWLRLLIL